LSENDLRIDKYLSASPRPNRISFDQSSCILPFKGAMRRQGALRTNCVIVCSATLSKCHYPDLDQLNDVEFSYHAAPPTRHPAQAKNLFPAFSISRNQVQSHQVLTLLQLNPFLQLPRRRQGAHTRASSQPRDRNKSRLPDLATLFLALVPYATQSIQMQGPNRAAYACARDPPRIFDVVSFLQRAKAKHAVIHWKM
jgi:hypothetical protein